MLNQTSLRDDDHFRDVKMFETKEVCLPVNKNTEYILNLGAIISNILGSPSKLPSKQVPDAFHLGPLPASDQEHRPTCLCV